MTWEQIRTKFEAYLLTERRVAHNTFNAYKTDLNQFCSFLDTKNLSFESIDSENLKSFIHYLYAIKLSARTIGRKISMLKTLFAYLSTHYSIKNYAKELHFPKIEKKLPVYLTQDEVKSLLSCAQHNRSELGIRNALVVYLLYVSGMRISELINLKITDIHPDTHCISVAGKGGRHRMIPLPQSMMDIVQCYVNKMCHSQTMGNDCYLFPVVYNKKIKPLSRQSCWAIVKQLCIKANIKHTVSPHQLRHSFATHMLEKGLDLRSLQMLLGHEDINTVQVYTHVETSQLRKIYDKKHPRS